MVTKPSIRAMLFLGLDVGLFSVDEALNNYLQHSDVFFDSTTFASQMTEFMAELHNAGLVVGGKPPFIPIKEPIERGLEMLDKYEIEKEVKL